MKNRTIIVIVIFGILTGCKSFDPDFLNATGNAFNPKLPAMETAVENNLVAVVNMSGQTIGASPQDILTLFDREVSEKMTNPYSDKRGYLLLKVNTIENKSCFLYPFLSGFFFIPNLFGMPYTDAKSVVEIQIDVMNANRKLIGSYRGGSEKHMKTGLYNKDNYRELSRVTYLLAVKEAIQEAKAKMIPDLNRLIAELEKQ